MLVRLVRPINIATLRRNGHLPGTPRDVEQQGIIFANSDRARVWA